MEYIKFFLLNLILGQISLSVAINVIIINYFIKKIDKFPYARPTSKIKCALRQCIYTNRCIYLLLKLKNIGLGASVNKLKLTCSL